MTSFLRSAFAGTYTIIFRPADVKINIVRLTNAGTRNNMSTFVNSQATSYK